MRLRIPMKIALLALGMIIVAQHPAAAQRIMPERLQIYVQNDTLKIDAGIDSLFTQRSLDAIESGMTASIAIHFRLVDAAGRQLAEIVHTAQLEHDIWEGEYRLIRTQPASVTLLFTRFADVARTCSDLQGLPLALLPLPDRPLILQTRIQVDPIPPEQQERTRKWLKILRKGSLLEFFFSLESASGQTPWHDVLKFHPGALPHLLPETQP